VFILPPQFAELGNYLSETAQAEAAYLLIPGHNWLRGLAAGGVVLALTLFGLVVSLVHVHRLPASKKRGIWLLFCATACQAAFLIAVVPLPFQRYSLPLVPFVCLWAALGVESLVQLAQNLLFEIKRQRLTRLAS
jgi:hypothetical protein